MMASEIPFAGNIIMLTDTKIRGIKPEPGPVKISDGGGLHLLVAPTGSKLWKCSYRFAGKQKTLSFGAYPEVGLADARLRREEAKGKLRQGIDPGKVIKTKKVEEKQAAANTFGAVADDWQKK